MSPTNGGKASSTEVKKSSFKTFLTKLRKRRIIETLAAFIAGGWLFLEFVDRILIAHYMLNKKWLDVSFITLLGALLCIILWRWFGGTEKRPGNVKIEVLIVPLIILIALAIDLNLILQIAGVPGKKLLIGIVAFLLGITWVIFKLSQWAAGMPETGKKEVGISPTATARPEKSIIVLPFANISPEEDQDYFCDGMTEEIITDLSHVRDLLVISRSSAMTFKGTKKTIPEIARAVNARYVLEGSVRKAGNNLRIAAQLINAETDVHLWADKFTGILDDVFDIQEKVSRSIVDALKLKLSPEEKRKINEKPIDNLAAYECYLKAYHEFYKFTEEGRSHALRYLESGLAIIGDNALLYSTMAFVYWQYWVLVMRTDEIQAKAEECVKKALALNPESPKAQAVRGWMVFDFNLRPQESVPYFKRALANNPNEFEALHGLARTYIYAGKIKEAFPLFERMMQMDPLNSVCWMFQGAMHFWDGRFDLALERLQKAYQMFPENLALLGYYADSLARSNMVDQAISIIDQMETASPNSLQTKWKTLLKYGLLNDRDRLFQELTEDFKKNERGRGGAYWVAVPLALVGAKKEALDWLENDLVWFHNYPFLAEKDPFLANIRGEPRFKKLMEQVKYQWEHFEV